MAQKIEIVRGTTNTIQITLVDGDGNLRALSSGDKILFGVKAKLDDPDYVFVRAATITETLGVYTVEIDKADTAELPCCTCYYDVGLQSGDDFFNIVETSPFIIKHNVTRWGCNG
jgi:hypothetical protein